MNDGHDPEFTEAILEILKQKQVKATFFVIGENARQNPSLLRRIITEGHEIGNHGYTHDYSQHKLTDEIKQTDQSVYTATGTHTYFYRPPGGFVTKSQINMIKNQGYESKKLYRANAGLQCAFYQADVRHRRTSRVSVKLSLIRNSG